MLGLCYVSFRPGLMICFDLGSVGVPTFKIELLCER